MQFIGYSGLVFNKFMNKSIILNVIFYFDTHTNDKNAMLS